MNLSADARRYLPCSLVLATALAAGTIQLHATARFGVGLSPDSAVYVQGARALEEGRGYTQLWPLETIRPVPITKYPPGYSSVLALGKRWNIDPVTMARPVGAVCLSMTILLTASLTLRASGSPWAAVAVAVLLAASQECLEMHSFALSEAMFIVLLQAALYGLCRQVERPSIPWLLTAAVAAAAAAMTRYVGIVLLPLALALIVILRKQSLRRSLIDATVYAAISGAPFLAWMIRNHSTAGSATARSVQWHPANMNHLRSLCMTLAQWTLPVGVDRLWWLVPLVIAFAVITAIVAFQKTASRPPRAVTVVLGAFTGIYLAALVVSISLFDAATPMDSRLLFPVFIPSMVLATSVFRSEPANRERNVVRGFSRGAVALLGAGMLLTGLVRTPPWVAGQYLSGDRLDYASRRWHVSRATAALKALRADKPIWTNAPDATYLRLGRIDLLTPWKEQADGTPRADFAAKIDQIRADIIEHGGAVAYFEGVFRHHQPALGDLSTSLNGLDRIDFPNDGTLWADPETAVRLRSAAEAATRPAHGASSRRKRRAVGG